MVAVKNFDSKFSTKKITAAQYLAELMIIRRAAKEGVKLDNSIWNDKKWKNYWLYQKTLAGNLLKLYPIGAIIQALSGELEWVYSLNTKAALKKFESIAIIQPTEEVVIPTQKRQEVKGESLFDKI